MNNILITGVAGVLGSSVAKLCVKLGYKVKGIDITRREEAWRLEEIIDKIEYEWKSVWDINKENVEGYDVVFDASIQFADRPMGITSPTHTLIGNLMPPLAILEAVRHCKRKPVYIYASSFNAFYGYPPGTIFTEKLLPNPSNLYGATKGMAELIALGYQKSYNIPIIITRVGSAFGSGRSDELPHKLILHCLKNIDFHLRSPLAKRLWTYEKDVLSFYEKVFNNLDLCINKTLHCCGNAKDEIITNWELAKRIKKLTKSNIKIIKGEYEPGELIGGKPIDFRFNSDFTRELLKWKPRYTIEEGLKESIKFFKKNFWRYVVKNERNCFEEKYNFSNVENQQDWIHQ